MHIQVVKSSFGPTLFLHLLLSWLVLLPCGSWSAEPKIQIQYPERRFPHCARAKYDPN